MELIDTLMIHVDYLNNRFTDLRWTDRSIWIHIDGSPDHYPIAQTFPINTYVMPIFGLQTRTFGVNDFSGLHSYI
ncbi:MAG TPA: hypothetical protein VJ941_01680 [Gracilimonas sp.]|nr:hypothetical protein [Gracilimonas sp.]